MGLRVKRTSSAPRAPRPPARPSPVTTLRMMFWIAQGCILLAAIHYFWILPKQTEAKPKPAVVVLTKPAPVLGDKARPLTGLQAVEPAQLPDVSQLAVGSLVAQQTQVQYSLGEKLPIEVQNSLGMRFRLLPPGTFLMGSPVTEKGRGAVEVQHVAQLREPVYMAVTEVTQAQWSALMPTNPSGYPAPAKPVEEVNWVDCMKFAELLTAREKLPAGSYRLPTEVEWEYACRAGTTTTYYFGDDPRRLDDYADYAHNNYKSPCVPGRRLPNAWGLHDMLGNVWEWCLDLYHPYVTSPGAQPGEDESWRVIRGGNWYVVATSCRAANRSRLPPLSNGNMLGFRLVRTIPELRAVAAPAAPPNPAAVPAAEVTPAPASIPVPATTTPGETTP